MQFNRLIYVSLVLSLCALALALAQETSSDSTSTLGPELNSRTDPSTSQNDRSSRGFLGLISSPFKSAINKARNLFGSRHTSLSESTNNMRAATYKLFMQLYNKTYPVDEIPRRMALFFERRKQIEQSVKMFNEGRLMFKMRENAFIDWEDDELKALAGVSLPSEKELAREEEESEASSLGRSERSINDEEEDPSNNIEELENSLIVKQDRIPSSKDWRNTNCVSTPINQMKCGACYAIATMSVVETMRCINSQSSPILSPQQIVDCATPRAGYENYGCDGGWPTRVFKYLQNVGVAARETCYPFIRRQTTCRLSQMQNTPGCTVSASPRNSRYIQYKILNNERDILYHVAKTGPVVTVMKATRKFQFYGSGIFDDSSCSNRRDDVDHAIVIVGYGRENGVDYWLIKNSWGTREWGEDGYGKYKRGTNACSIGHWGWVVTG